MLPQPGRESPGAGMHLTDSQAIKYGGESPQLGVYRRTKKVRAIRVITGLEHTPLTDHAQWEKWYNIHFHTQKM